ncbi:MAG: transposase family protein [Betaproteobacteria bacterium]|nr:transposase family protein [Betaproteobacteria bacterium]
MKHFIKAQIGKGQRSKLEHEIKIVAKKLADDNPPSVSTAANWYRAFLNAGQAPSSLVPGTLFIKRKKRVHRVVERIITRHIAQDFLTRKRHSIEFTHSQALRSLDIEVASGTITKDEAALSRSTLSRRIHELDPYTVDRARFGEVFARAKYRTTFGREPLDRPLQRVEVDHTPLNWVVLCDKRKIPLGRPTLTCISDSYSGYIISAYISFYGAGITSVLNALKIAILPKDSLTRNLSNLDHEWLGYGIPEIIVVDNGPEFHSTHFKLALWNLLIDILYCRSRTPWQKPHIERAFADLGLLPSDNGHVRQPIKNVLEIDPRKNAVITFSDFCWGILKWIIDLFPFHENIRKLSRPYDVFLEGLERTPPARFPSSTSELDLIAAISKEVTVSHGGIEFLYLCYSSPVLLSIKKEVGSKFKTTIKCNPNDLGFLYVQHPINKTWVIVPCLDQEYADGLSLIQHKLIRKFQKENLKEKSFHKSLLRSKQEFYEMWQGLFHSKGSRSTAKLLARGSGYSSTNVWSGLSAQNSQTIPGEKLIVPQYSQFDSAEIPSFETFAS